MVSGTSSRSGIEKKRRSHQRASKKGETIRRESSLDQPMPVTLKTIRGTQPIEECTWQKLRICTEGMENLLSLCGFSGDQPLRYGTKD